MNRRRIGVVATLLAVSILSTIDTAVLAQDTIAAGATGRSGTANGTMTIPVFVKDITGTLAGRDKTTTGQISDIEFRIVFDGTKIAGCLAAQGNCNFVPAGLLSVLKVSPTPPNNPCDNTIATGCSFLDLVQTNTSLTYTVTTAVPIATTADPVGNLIGYVTVVLASNFSGTTTSTLDAAAGFLGGTDNTTGETVANANLTLNNAVIQKANYDVDANGSVDAFTDGILMIRRMLGASGTSLTLNGNAVGSGSLRPASADLAAYMDSLGLVKDVDGNGTVDAFTDGILTIRFMLGASGTSLTLNGNAVGAGCTRCTPAAIQAYLAQMIQN